MMSARRLAAHLVVAMSLAWGMAGAQAPQADPGAAPTGDSKLRDPDFRVQGGELGLERRVVMYQWRKDDEGYAKTWSREPIDSSQFEADHENPPFPLEGERWEPDAILVDGHPLAPDVVEQLGEWREFRPAFSALPGNLSATFQPEGNGLGSAENPLDPQVGDLRIHWRERVLPPLAERIELRGGRWELRPDAPAVVDAAPVPRGWLLAWLPIILGGGGLLVLAVVLARKRRR